MTNTAEQVANRYESLLDLLCERDAGRVSDIEFLEMVMDRIAQAERRGAVEALRSEAKTLRSDGDLYQGFKGDRVRRAMTADLAKRLNSHATALARQISERCATVEGGLRCVFDDAHGCEHGYDRGQSNSDWPA